MEACVLRMLRRAGGVSLCGPASETMGKDKVSLG